jgi:hypothetical protein
MVSLGLGSACGNGLAFCLEPMIFNRLFVAGPRLQQRADKIIKGKLRLLRKIATRFQEQSIMEKKLMQLATQL